MERVQHGVQLVQHGLLEQHDGQVRHEVLVQRGVQGQRGVQALREVLVKASLVLHGGQQLALSGGSGPRDVEQQPHDARRVLQRDEEWPDDERRRPPRDERLQLRDVRLLSRGGRWELRAFRGPLGVQVQPRDEIHPSLGTLEPPRQS